MLCGSTRVCTTFSDKLATGQARHQSNHAHYVNILASDVVASQCVAYMTIKMRRFTLVAIRLHTRLTCRPDSNFLQSCLSGFVCTQGLVCCSDPVQLRWRSPFIAKDRQHCNHRHTPATPTALNRSYPTSLSGRVSYYLHGLTRISLRQTVLIAHWSDSKDSEGFTHENCTSAMLATRPGRMH